MSNGDLIECGKPCQTIARLLNCPTMTKYNNNDKAKLLVGGIACLLMLSGCTLDQLGGQSVAADKTEVKSAHEKEKDQPPAKKKSGVLTEFKVGKKGKLLINTTGFKEPGDYVSWLKGMSSNRDLSPEMRAQQRMTILFDRMDGPSVVILNEPVDHSIDQLRGDEKIVKIRVLSGVFSGQEWYVRTNTVREQ